MTASDTISFTPDLSDSEKGTLLHTSIFENRFDGDGDVVLDFQGNVTSVSLAYTAGEGENYVGYTFAAVPEPSAFLAVGLFAAIGTCVRGWFLWTSPL